MTSIHEGFDFLGWNFRKYNGKLIIKPSNKSIRKIRKTISEVIKGNKTSTQESLIYQLNQIIRGWAEYHHSACSKKTFSQIDHTTWEMLWNGRKGDIQINVKAGLSINTGSIIKGEIGVLNQTKMYSFI